MGMFRQTQGEDSFQAACILNDVIRWDSPFTIPTLSSRSSPNT